MMNIEQPRGSCCQNCAMPMAQTKFMGTEADGSKSEKYCVYCYQDGKFIQPDTTLEQMIEISAKGWSDQDPTVTFDQAEAQMANVIPQLERWRK